MAGVEAREQVVERVLRELVALVAEALSEQLRSVVLFGSAAEGSLRATSDVNVVLVLRRFDLARIDGIREALRTAAAAIALRPMFLCEDEIPLASEVFADKLADIVRRRRVLYGDDPFAGLTLSRSAELARLRQLLLNLELRLRQRYALSSLRQEQAALAVADAAGPLRACAAMVLELRGTPAASPKEALLQVVADAHEPALRGIAEQLSVAREQRALPPGQAARALGDLLTLTGWLRGLAAGLAP